MSVELKHALRPAIHHCMRQALGVQELLEAARWVFVDLAAEDLKRAGEKVNISRLSVITGLQRPVVQALLAERQEKDPSRFTVRVISTWRNSKAYLAKNKQPKVLPYDGKRGSFTTLVQSVSKDLHPGTVLFDLQRLDLVEVSEKGIKLKGEAQITKRGTNRGYEQLSRDTEDLMMAVISNIEWPNGQLPNYHGTTSFDNLDESDLDQIRAWIFTKFSKFHKEVESYLAGFDLDLNPDPKKAGGKRVMMGVFSKTTP